MIRRFLVYTGESAALSVLLWLAAVLTLTAMRTLGYSVPKARLRVYLQLLAVSLVINVVGSEVWGAEFLFLYKLAALAPLLGAIFWAIVLVRRRWRAPNKD